jgi:N-methylhydantoinase B/oxoprolinase/acetone carboxylase alpha subunit
MGIKLDTADMWKPSPPSARELECVSMVEAADFEIYSKKLDLICAEAREIFVKMGAAQMLQSGDVALGIYTAQGDLAACDVSIYLHLVVGQIPVKYVLQTYLNDPTVGIRDGDIYFVNEATFGGIHNPDMIAFMPIFHEDELVGWTLAALHEGETGAVDPGGMSVAAHTRYDEGMHWIPIKVGENYQLKRDLVDMMANQVRDPRMHTIDLKARAAACERMIKRVREEVIARKGVDFFIGLMRKGIDTAIEAGKARVRELNDGVYRTPMFLDAVGVDYGLVRMMLTLRKEGDEITLDFSGTSPETPDGPFNTYKHVVIAGSALYIYQFLFSDLPPTAGAMSPFNYEFTPGSLLDAGPDAAVACGVLTSGFLAFYAIPSAFAKMLFDSDWREKAVASWGTPSPPFLYGGLNQYGLPVAGLAADALNTQGAGARQDRDGENAAGFSFCPTGVLQDAEFTELQLPWFYLFRNRFMADNHGMGKHRGGSGVMIGYVPHNVPFLVCGSSQGGNKFPPEKGLFGGYAAMSAPAVSIIGSDLAALMAESSDQIPYDVYEMLDKRAVTGDYQIESMIRPFRAVPGDDIILMPSLGGSSYGDVLERDPQLVMEDLRSRVSSHWAAQNVYHVVYDPQTLRPDHEATAKARDDERARRKQRGKPYDEFEKEWLQKRPADEILKRYGDWPNP